LKVWSNLDLDWCENKLKRKTLLVNKYMNSSIFGVMKSKML